MVDLPERAYACTGSFPLNVSATVVGNASMAKDSANSSCRRAVTAATDWAIISQSSLLFDALLDSRPIPRASDIKI